ncbi:YkgJ family cysteine cluster protein [Nannocystis punicea]|uniref:Zinc-or iron-chelating domain-containing protein n=1 Tax=Nannocystis punicea TaxID=2995304 RepID=A0ABY7H825_9BACT|nr:hypothetical protein [Nannocystis poenicansa]WAS95237.1 hypothetical protein O0S08_03670 [Nannocystis poenicansa]
MRDSGPEQLLAKYGVEPIADLPDETKKFHLRVLNDVLAGHDRCQTSLGALWATQTWHKHHDGLAASRPSALLFGDTEMHLACKPGCNHCCHSPVGVVGAEAVLIAHVVARSFSAQDRLGLERRMAERKAALQSGDPQRGYLCPLNVGGNCSVYEFRPFNCRMFHSFDADACASIRDDGKARGGLPIDRVRRQFDKLIVASANVALGALKLDMRLLEFTAALELALAAGDGRCERFAAGENLFASLPTIASSSAAAPE